MSLFRNTHPSVVSGRPAARLAVESLEDRLVPSTAYLLVTTVTNPVGALVQFGRR